MNESLNAWPRCSNLQGPFDPDCRDRTGQRSAVGALGQAFNDSL